MTHKEIHYCWFGKNPKPDIILKCIESWKKYCPDCDIIEWNEDNFDINCCDYVSEAYLEKKWAFVSDYARFWILYNYGGVYVDTDVEFIKSIFDLPNSFIGFESENYLASGLIRAAEKGDEFCKIMIDSYHSDKFKKNDGSLNLKTVCERETEMFKKFGLIVNGKNQKIKNTYVYGIEYFCPLAFNTGKLTITKNTYSIHHYDSSWYSEKEIYALKLKRRYNKYLPKKTAGRLAHFIAQCKYDGIKSAIRTTLKKLRKDNAK